MYLKDFLAMPLDEIFEKINSLERENKTVDTLKSEMLSVEDELAAIRNERNQLAENWPKKFKSPIPGIGRET